jgi:hypothetical protein
VLLDEQRGLGPLRALYGVLRFGVPFLSRPFSWGHPLWLAIFRRFAFWNSPFPLHLSSFFYDTSISLTLLLLLEYCFFLELTSALPCRAEGSSSYQLTPILAGHLSRSNFCAEYLLYPRHLANVPHARLIPESSVDMAATDVALGALYIKFS